MRKRRNINCLIGASVFTLLLAARVWPHPHRKWTEVANGYRYTYESSRRYEMLPLCEWGLRPCTLTGCGPNGGIRERTFKLLFFAVVDESSVEFHPIVTSK